MKSGKVLFNVLTLLITLASGQNGEFEGSTESNLGDDRLIDFTDDTRIIFRVIEDTSRQVTRASTAERAKIADCAPVNLPVIGFNFKGNVFTRAYVCANGLVKFDGRSYELNPRNFGTYSGQQSNAACLAPYWSFVDLDYFQFGLSNVYFRRYENQADDVRGVFLKAREYGNTILEKVDYTPAWITVITWEDLRPKNPGDVTYNGKNTFQLFLANSAENEAIVVYLYKDIDWSVGVIRARYSNYDDSSDLPVVGFNSGEAEDLYPYDNMARSGTVDVEEVDDFVDSVLQKRGEIGIDLREKRPTPPTSAELCQRWISNEIYELRTRRFCRTWCAPTLNLERRAWGGRFRRLYKEEKDGQNRFFPNFCVFSPRRRRQDADECCYEFFGSPFVYFLNIIFRTYNGYFLVSNNVKGAGHWHAYHPRRNRNKYLEEKEAYRRCCTEPGHTDRSCSQFYSIRPTCNSLFWFFPSLWAALFGDPHFVTLDGKNYTFNGCGWYTYFKGSIPGNNESLLVVQVRTTRVGNVNATGFTGIAIKEGDTETIQVNLKPGGGLIINVAGNDFTLGPNATELDSGSVLSYENETLEISTTLGNGVRIKESANGTFFTFVTAFLKEYQNSSVGLSGKWNGNVDDDFTIPNGSVYSIDMSDSEIFHNFGQAWRVQNDERIYQNINDNLTEYTCPDNFVPIFFDEAVSNMNASLRAEADRVCGNDLSCLFDIAATNDISIGQETLTEITNINNEIALVQNNLPVFIQNISTINVTFGETFKLIVEAEDPDDDELTFDVPFLPPGSSYTSSGNQLNFTWLVNSVQPANLTILVQDTKNGTATLSPNIQLCRCENNGTCFVPESTSQQTAAVQLTFLIMSCNCLPGYTGAYCGEVRDFCAGELTPPCNPLVTCTNSPTGFTCGPCPAGYAGDGQICADIDECEGNQTDCEQTCTNNVASYVCGCNSGFSLDSDERACNDIDECSRPNDCSQLCNNTIGSYQCYCRIGFEIDQITTTNCIAKTKCGTNDCSQICFVDPVSGQEKCDCGLGYVLRESDMKSCDDINECENTQSNLCDQGCINTEGSYNCSCLPGYEMTSRTACTDINECSTDGFICNGVGEECENIPGSYRCACSSRLNMVRVNGTCIFREDETIVADLAPTPPTPTQEQIDNAIQITLANFQEINYTVEADVLFKDSVVKLLNDFCNQNSLRPQDCGVSQNQLYFSEREIKRLPDYPRNDQANAIIKFYVKYPSIVKNSTVDQAILASILFAELQKLERLTSFNITLDTSVTPPSPGNPTTNQRDNAVTLRIPSFSRSQWTTFYDTVFRRSVALALNKYCEIDSYTRTEDCGLSNSESFDLDDVVRLPNNPVQNSSDVDVEFYVLHPRNNPNPVLQKTLASMLISRKADLVSALAQQVEVQTSAVPSSPPIASSDQQANSVVIRISSYERSQWTYLIDQRLRKTIANRVATYCGKNLGNCQIPAGNTASFNESDVQRSSSATPSDIGNSIDYSFYVKYPGTNSPMIQYILTSVMKIELDAIQADSTLFFSLQTPLDLPTPPAPNSSQSSNTVQIKILNQQADQWHGIQDKQFRAAIATQITSYCSSNVVVCGVTSGQVSFNLSHVTRIESSPLQDGQDANYSLFIDYPSGSGPLQRNLLAGILTNEIETIKNVTSLDLSVVTSTLAVTPPSASTDQVNRSIILSAYNVQANQWSAIQDNRFRGYVARTIAQYCQASEARMQECKLQGNRVSFTTSHVQRVPGYPSQNGGNAEIQFYVDYPAGGTMSQEILLLIINEQLTSIATNTALNLTIVTTIVPPTVAPPTEDNRENAVNVVLLNFQASQWLLRDLLFRQNMADEIKAFCRLSDYHRNICNISEADINAFTSDHIRRLPNSPAQNGSNSILSFYAVLPSGATLPKSVLATIFTSQQDKILSVTSQLQDPSESIPSSIAPALTSEQAQNLVPITIFNFEAVKVNTLTIIDVKVTIAARMTIFCFSTSGNVCGLSTTTSRKKRAADSQEFSQNDVLADSNNVAADGNNTVLGVVVNEPGTSTPVRSNIVQDALHQTLQEQNQSDISNLSLAVVNAPIVSDTERSEVLNVWLINTQASQWTLQRDISFRKNMSQAIIKFCDESSARLQVCNLTRSRKKRAAGELDSISLQNVQILPNSPTQDGNDAILSFFVNLPNGATMPSELLCVIFTSSSNVISQPTRVNKTSENPDLSSEQIENLIPITVKNGIIPLDQLCKVRFALQYEIAKKLNSYCGNNSRAAICNGTFTTDNVLINIDPDTERVSFVVLNPGTRSPIPADSVQDAIDGDIVSTLLPNVIFTVPAPDSDSENEVDWPLILGLSIGGVLLFLFVVVSIIICVCNTSKRTKFKEYGFENESVYSARGWQFDRESPYTGSPFASIDAIPGFDEDGLPSDARHIDTRV